MRNLTALLLLLSLGSLYLVSTAPSAFDHKTRCCRSTITARIPLRNILTYWRTGSSCPLQAIVFHTRNVTASTTHLRCVDPTAVWVDSHMRKVDLRNKSTETSKH